MLYINERTGNIINVRVPVHGGGWRPLRAAPAAPGTAAVSHPLAENVVQSPENGPPDESDAPAAAIGAEPDATVTAPAAPGPKKPTPRPAAPRRTTAKKTAAKKPVAKRSTSSSRKAK